MYPYQKRKGVLFGMRRYLADRKRIILTAAGLWIFLDLYLGVICSSRLYGQDIVYLNVLLGAVVGVTALSDYGRWRRIDRCLRGEGVLSQAEEQNLFGAIIGEYLCSERARLEQSRKNNKKELEELSDYIAGWTHEAKLPLASLYLMNDRNSDQVLKREMQDCIARLETLIQNVMVESKLQRPENDVRYEKIFLESAVKKSIQNQSYYLIHENFQITLDLQNICVYTDQRWLVYLLDQLAANAVKYRGKDPALCFQAVRLEDGSVELSVEDNGIGICQEEIPWIFQKGYVGKNLRKGDYRSTGMGLYFVKKIADMMQISVSVSSKQGEGSRFILHFQNLSDHFLLEEHPAK